MKPRELVGAHVEALLSLYPLPPKWSLCPSLATLVSRHSASSDGFRHLPWLPFRIIEDCRSHRGHTLAVLQAASPDTVRGCLSVMSVSS
uniref:Macaca fascicularis brain cDNA, clone: QmoA-11213 n=1 Tax=Macaca fascicularis TaxID=9541 RepID=I7GP86_MACFA|nr:unnamed protein product [Macaca fascicularis]